jgi:hypothetical protein
MAKIPSRKFAKIKKKIPSRKLPKSQRKIPSRKLAAGAATLPAQEFSKGPEMAIEKPDAPGRPSDEKSRQDRLAALKGKLKSLTSASDL